MEPEALCLRVVRPSVCACVLGRGLGGILQPDCRRLLVECYIHMCSKRKQPQNIPSVLSFSRPRSEGWPHLSLFVSVLIHSY